MHFAPGVHSASNRNEYQKQKNNVSGEQVWQPYRNLRHDCLYNVKYLTFRYPIGIQGLVHKKLYFSLYLFNNLITIKNLHLLSLLFWL
jgi:hypothetical protein